MKKSVLFLFTALIVVSSFSAYAPCRMPLAILESACNPIGNKAR
ncbi:hypothetical protein [Paenibacillus sp. 1A_MP2]